MTNAVATVDHRTELALPDLKRQADLIAQLLKEMMVPGQHYGRVPGTDNVTLLKPGAEKLCMVFRLSPTFHVDLVDLADGHRDYRVECTLTHIPTGGVVANGIGSCTTMESKYRWRHGTRRCPSCGKDTIRKGAEGFYCWKKLDGCGKNFVASDQSITSQTVGKVPNQDIADTYNTVLKMACKRALVAAVQIATAASDMFGEEEEKLAEEVEEDERRERDAGRRAQKAEPKPEKEAKPEKEQKLTPRQAMSTEIATFATRLNLKWKDLCELMAGAGMPEVKDLNGLSEADLQRLMGLLNEQAKMIGGAQ